MNAFRAKRQATGRIDLLPPEPKTPAQRHGQRFPRRLEVVDADFVVIRTGAARTSNDNHRANRQAPGRPLSQHIAFRVAAACARFAETGLQQLPNRAFIGLVGAIFLFVFAYTGGLTALKAAILPAGADEPLRIAEVTATLGDQNGMRVLAVYGRVDNTGDRTLIAPPLQIIMEGTERTLQRRTALDTTTIAPGGSEHFALRIPHGGGKVPKVSVSFVREGAPAN